MRGYLSYLAIPIVLGLGLAPAHAVTFNTDFLWCPGAAQCSADGQVMLTLNALGIAEPITSANPLPTTGGGGGTGGAVTQSGTWTVQPGNTQNTIPWLVSGQAAFPIIQSGVLSVGPSTRTIIPLDVSGVAVSGTAVNILNAGHATAGGTLVTSNAAGMCVNQYTVAGTSTSGTTICVVQNQSYNLVPSTGAVSVNSLASGVIMGGWGLN